MHNSSPQQKIVYVLKASGEKEPFNRQKLAHSLRSSGADEQMVSEILSNIESSLSDGMTTKKIYSRALSLLGRKLKSAEARYSVKNALMEFGMSGYPFEIFIGELFKKQGYSVEVGIVVPGVAVDHEMDVIATKKDAQHLVECKYSQARGNYVSIQVPLYVHSRVTDIINHRQKDTYYQNTLFQGWVVTNTRFSSDSTNYANYYGLNLLSWDYPVDNGLKNLIVREKLYPITILSKLNEQEKKNIIAAGIVTCEQLAHNQSILNELNFSNRKRKELYTELELILKSDSNAY